jgi:hypothetical protein
MPKLFVDYGYRA